MFKPPVRLCCGQRHRGVVCPDGLVMCQLCFERFPPNRLAVEDDQTIDICVPCWMHDKGIGTHNTSE